MQVKGRRGGPTRPALLVALALLLSGGWTRESFAQGDGDATARALFIEGAKLANQGRWSEALTRYAASLQRKPAPLTRYSLGVAQRETGHFAAAIASFRAFLAEAPTAATTPYVQPAQSAIVDLLALVGRLALTVEPAEIDGLTLTLDGDPIGAEPVRDVDPGPHEVTARAPGFRERSTRFLARGGASSTLTLTLVPLTALGPRTEVGGSVALAPPLAPKATLPVLPLVLVGAGGGLLLTGAVVGLVAVKQAGDAPTRGGSEARSAQSKAIAGDVLAGAGLVTLGVGIVLLLIHTRPAPPRAGSTRISMSEIGSGLSLHF